AAFEQPGKQALEIRVHLFERGQEPLAAFAVQALDATTQTLDGADEVIAITSQRLEPRLLLGRLFFSAQVDAAKLFALLLQLLDTLLRLVERRQFLAFLDLGALSQIFRDDF